MGFVVTVFIVVCAVVAWLKARGWAGPQSWRRQISAMGWGLALLPVALIGLLLFGTNLITIGLGLLCGSALVLRRSDHTASRHQG
jgi:hypothetical protein